MSLEQEVIYDSDVDSVHVATLKLVKAVIISRMDLLWELMTNCQ